MDYQAFFEGELATLKDDGRYRILGDPAHKIAELEERLRKLEGTK